MTGISRMLGFLALLKDNNNRPWFAERKEEYEAIRRQCLAELGTLIDGMARFDPRMVGVTPQECTYRIYCDIRFSPDKSPFKTHFGAVIAPGGRKCKEAGCYLHIEPGECFLCGGVWFPEQPVLNFLRHNILDNIDEFMEIINEPNFRKHYPTLAGDSLKTMPKGFPKDCPHEEIIRMKEFLVLKKYNDSLFSRENWQRKVIDDIRRMKPFVDFLNYAFEELRTN